MVFIVETGNGTPGANAYCTPAFVLAYLTERGRQTENSYSGIGDPAQKAAIIKATDYIETRWGPLFRGVRARSLIPGRQASGLLVVPVLPVTGTVLIIGQKTYRLVDTLVQENDVKIGANVSETFLNIAAAVGGVVGDGTAVESHTLPNYEAGILIQGADLAVYALSTGENGNTIAFSSTIAGATLTGSGFLIGGLDDAPQPLSFPRARLTMRDGTYVYGIPLKLKQATAEYSVRALAAALSIDPPVSPAGQILSQSVTAGPISKETTYAQSISGAGVQPYPAADKLLSDYVLTGGGVYR